MVREATGTADEQLPPAVEQIVGAEVQEPRVPGALPRIEEPPQRIAPLPTVPRAPLPTPERVQEQIARQTLFGQPVLKTGYYSGGSKEWVMLVRWDVPEGFIGDLEELALLSNNDSVTRFRILINGTDQGLPVDRQISTPVSWPWHKTTIIPGGAAVTVEVRSTDETSINVDASITATER